MHATATPRQIPRLLSPRLPLSRPWARFLRSTCAGHLRAAAASLRVTAVVISALVLVEVILVGKP